MRLISKKVLPGTFKRYDLTIEKTHNFVCEGIVVHNTSAHIQYHPEKLVSDGNGGEILESPMLTFSPGGCKYDHFMLNFPQARQDEILLKISSDWKRFADITIYGEAYGGKLQKMGDTYGPDLKFIAFEVLIGESWLTVDRAAFFCSELGIEFVHYERGPATIEWLDSQRDADSVQAIRNGMGPGKKREGIVVHPLMELVYPQGEGRIIAKHKRDDFAEFAHQPKVQDEGKAKRIFAAEQIVDQWVVPMRLDHVVDALAVSKGVASDDLDIKNTKEVIAGMVADLQKEGSDEIIFTPELLKVIGNKTVALWKQYLNNKIKEG